MPLHDPAAVPDAVPSPGSGEGELDRIRAAAVSTLAVWPEARAAVLFGSRARGDHRPDSDWDVGFITRARPASDAGAGEDCVRPLPEGLPTVSLPPTVQCLAVSEDLLARRGASIGHIAREIACDGRLLAGEWSRPDTEGKTPRMHPDDYVQAVDSATASMRDAALEASRIGSTSRWSFDRGACNRFAAASANASEHLARVMLGRHGIDHRFVHDLNILAAQANDAGFGGLASTIRSLNGLTRSHHAARYGGLDADGCRHAVQRFLRLAAVLGNEIQAAALHPELIDAAHDLREETALRAEDCAAALRSGATQPPATEAPPHVQELVRALTAARPALASTLEDLASTLRGKGEVPPPPASSFGM